MTGITEVRNGRVVTPSGVVEGGRVVVSGDRIARVDRASANGSPGPTTVDADGRVVMPGIIDLHGDDIEHHRSPRAGASVDARTALTAADRANLLNGVTTKFHAVAFEESPDDGRTLRTAETIAAEIRREEYTLGDNRLHARCELADASAEAVEGVVDRFGVDLLSVMHHAPGDGQYDDEEFERHYVEDRNWPAASVDDAMETRRSLDDATEPTASGGSPTSPAAPACRWRLTTTSPRATWSGWPTTAPTSASTRSLARPRGARPTSVSPS
ncbi:hypothetical protein [Halorubrum saccharovorum]|uniref:hypothetical protein n=1 Tax=Halorubrum saccharovorum TaxID=2248 RepID=UPI001F4152CB|nr:hypothetical protein [Halorubrum saccharovorum]